MKPITMYEADDGSVWRTPSEAAKRDDTIAACAAVVLRLGLRDVPDDTDFANGHGFVQQPTGSRDRLLNELRTLGATRDSDGPIGRLLARFYRIDEQDREWGQQYFAAHPDQGELVAR